MEGGRGNVLETCKETGFELISQQQVRKVFVDFPLNNAEKLYSTRKNGFDIKNQKNMNTSISQQGQFRWRGVWAGKSEVGPCMWCIGTRLRQGIGRSPVVSNSGIGKICKCSLDNTGQYLSPQRGFIISLYCSMSILVANVILPL